MKYPHLKYAEDVVSGKIVAGKDLKLLCKRQLKLHKNPGKYVYIDAYADGIRRFLRYLPHIEGIWATRKQLFEPQPWQDFIISEMYGWRHADETDKRKYNQVIIQVAKKNGKTFLSSGIALYELKYAAPGSGAKVYSAATQRDQAALVWKAAKEMIRRMPPEITHDIKITQNLISLDTGTDEFAPVSREANTLEGKNPSCVIFDEAALIENIDVFTNLQTAAAGRMGHQLEVYITTAQGLITSPYMDMREVAKDVLNGTLKDEHMLPVLYEVDEDDDPLKDESCWGKANPNLEVSVSIDFLRKKVEEANRTPSMKAGILNKHFNKWTSAAQSFLAVEDWDKCAGEPMMRGDCYIGLDLASVHDLCSISLLFYPEPMIAHLFVKAFLSKGRFDALPENIKAIYQEAIDVGELQLNDGFTTSLPAAERFIRECMDEHDVRRVGADPHNAQQMVNQLEEDYPGKILIVRQNRPNMSPGIKRLERHILDRKFVHSGTRFLRWQFANCRIDEHPETEQLLLVKNHPDHKIDSITSTVVGLRCADEPADLFSEFNFTIVDLDSIQVDDDG